MLAIVGYASGLLVLLSLSFLHWIALLFPAWVFAVSVVALVLEWHRHGEPGAP